MKSQIYGNVKTSQRSRKDPVYCPLRLPFQLHEEDKNIDGLKGGLFRGMSIYIGSDKWILCVMISNVGKQILVSIQFL